jgi:hypothetical protein
MKTNVDVKFLWGRLKQSNNFYRYDGNSGNTHIDKILRYGCGLFIVIRTKSKSWGLRYTCHFSDDFYRISKRQKVECTVLGYSS